MPQQKNGNGNGSDAGAMNDPKQYLTAKNIHCHAPMTGGELCFNYNDLLLKKWARQRSEKIKKEELALSENPNYYINYISAPYIPSEINIEGLVEHNDPRMGHPDNPKYEYEPFDAYNTHGHTPFDGGQIIWNNQQLARKINLEFQIYQQIVPEETAKAVSGVLECDGDRVVPEPSGTEIVSYNIHSHSPTEGGIIAQNEWMRRAILVQKIHEYNQASHDELDFSPMNAPSPISGEENALFGESQKSGTGASGVLEITDPLPSGTNGFVNPSITAPGFGTEVVFNDKQLKIVLNKLIELGLIRKPNGDFFNGSGEPTRAYNVHRHTSEFDGGEIYVPPGLVIPWSARGDIFP